MKTGDCGDWLATPPYLHENKNTMISMNHNKQFSACPNSGGVFWGRVFSCFVFLYSPQKEKCNNAIIAMSAVPCIEYYKKKTWYKGHNNSDL